MLPFGGAIAVHRSPFDATRIFLKIGVHIYISGKQELSLRQNLPYFAVKPTPNRPKNLFSPITIDIIDFRDTPKFRFSLYLWELTLRVGTCIWRNLCVSE